MDIIVNPILSKSDIEDIVKIHMNSFTGFFLTFLGKGFLKQLYKGFVYHENSGIIVAKKENSIIGVLAYSEDLNGFYKNLIKTRLIPFAWYSLKATIRRPSVMFRLVRAFLKPKESKREERYIEISSIGVLPDIKGQGIGSLMIDTLKKIFDSHKFSYINLETDAVDNDYVNNFYKKNGFVLFRTFKTPEGRIMNEYRWTKNRR